ncbi:GNAT family protein [Acidothermaceae bacterium B102]|nr:GNAT family protein [Acidothermaceae bacterium B102]
MDLVGHAVTLRPVDASHGAELRRIRRTPEVTFRWYDVDAEPDWPFDEPGSVGFTILCGARVAGFVQYYEENEAHYRHAGIDILVDPALHNRGIGRDAIATLAKHLIDDRGHHRLVIDPAADNEAAIRCYTAVGFRPVGILRQQERNNDDSGWHDALLMDLLADELVR